MRSTAATIKPAFAFAKEHGIDFVSVIPMTAFTHDMVDEILVWDTAAHAAVHAELAEESRRTGVPLHMQPPITHWREDGHAPCDIPWGSAVVLGNGDVHTCYVPQLLPEPHPQQPQVVRARSGAGAGGPAGSHCPKRRAQGLKPPHAAPARLPALPSPIGGVIHIFVPA